MASTWPLSETRLSGGLTHGGQSRLHLLLEGTHKRTTMTAWSGARDSKRAFGQIVVAPTFINERLLTLRIPLVKRVYVTVLSCYAPSLTGEENLKGVFYEQIHQALSSINKNYKIILLGDFNARVGRRKGVRKNEQQRLVSPQSVQEFDLPVTNPIFRMKDRF